MIREYGFIFFFGAVAYSMIEIIFRGWTHWTMMLTGGAVFLLLYILHAKMQPAGRLVRCLVGCCMITLIEFSVGCLVNRVLHLGVWDYSGQPFNLLGQICPAFSGVWFVLCVPADGMCAYMQRCLFNTLRNSR